MHGWRVYSGALASATARYYAYLCTSATCMLWLWRKCSNVIRSKRQAVAFAVAFAENSVYQRVFYGWLQRLRTEAMLLVARRSVAQRRRLVVKTRVTDRWSNYALHRVWLRQAYQTLRCRVFITCKRIYLRVWTRAFAQIQVQRARRGLITTYVWHGI